MASQIVKTPAVGTPLIRLRQNFHSRRTIDSQHSRGSCACRLSASHSEITTTDKALRGAAAAFLSFSLFTCQPASADLNRFEAAAGGEFGVGTAAQFGEAELRGKDFSGQVHLPAVACDERLYFGLAGLPADGALTALSGLALPNQSELLNTGSQAV